MENIEGVAKVAEALPVKYIRETPEDYKLKRFDNGDWTDVRVLDVEVDGQPVVWIDGIAIMDAKQKKTFEVLTVEEGEMADILDNQVKVPVKYIKYGRFQTVKCMLGFAMQLPEGEEAHLAPRSSTFKNWGFLQTNSVGVVDNSYCGDNDEWMQEFFATRVGFLCKFDRVGQFRTMKKQEERAIVEVEKLGNPDRGAYGEGTAHIK